MVSSDLTDDNVMTTRRTRHNGAVAERSSGEDPARDPVDVAREQTATLVRNISSAAMEQLRQLRDQTDDLMNAFDERERALKDQIAAHAEIARDVIATKVIMSESMEHLVSHFKPAPKPTITQGR